MKIRKSEILRWLELESALRRIQSLQISLAILPDGTLRTVISEADVVAAADAGASFYAPGDAPYLEKLTGLLVRFLDRFALDRPQVGGDSDRLRRLLPAIAGKHGSDWFTVAELMADAIFPRLTDGMTNVQLGLFLSQHAGKTFGGIAIEVGPKKKHARLRRVVRVIHQKGRVKDD